MGKKDNSLKHCEECDLFYEAGHNHDCEEWRKRQLSQIKNGLKLVRIGEYHKKEKDFK